MNTKRKLTGLAVAAAAAAAFATATVPTTAFAGSAEVGKCMGVNACKGHGSCKTASNSCAGHNACKGKGFVKMSSDQCTQVGGDEAIFERIKGY